MKLFWHLLHTGVPWQIVLFVITIASLLTAILVCKCYVIKSKRILIVWIVAYLFLILYSTVFGREAQESVSMHLIPFWSIEAIHRGLIETYYEKLYNIIFFVPYGVMLGMYIQERVIVRSMMVGVITSIGIELLQLITKTGTCETDDVICNTVGSLMGACLICGIIQNYKSARL